ncbi:alpha/beta fold hydrolase [Candidatus Enterococcus ikei]|uniref:Lysophospholipase n=1 Tax=Candidatus Enterococcus ikei TaxID=2815326 RepID=A0ABS3GZZ8_9ENTE|nr:alpha/beta fold hydrolase [Enterococcus sp. DIV0869a]MBO0440820.1 lysophospholipase [Enterococcus sp. DIV0869a]
MLHNTFLSSDQKTMSHFICWEPEQEAIGVVQIIHGMAEYIERYHDFAEYLNGLGYVVVGHDHLGHGESVTKDAAKHGYFGKGDPVSFVLKDIHQIKEWITEHYPKLPHFMLGHSMGSFALRNYLQFYKPEISGAIFMGTGKKATLLPVALSLTNTLNLTAPEKTNERLDQLAFGDFSKQFPEAGRFNWLSKSQDNVRRYENDPLTGFTFTNNGFYTLFRLVDGANRTGWAEKIDQNLSILVISGEQDPVGDFGKGPRKVAKDLDKAGIKDVSLVLFAELRHEILLEDEKNEVYKAISNWMKKRLDFTIEN